MDQPELLKNIAFAQALDLDGLVEYAEGQVVSRTLAQNNALSLTLFAFDQGEGISAHTVPADALVLVFDGAASVEIDGHQMTVAAGQVVAMPQGKPHALAAKERFKMLLVVVRAPQQIQL